MTRNLLDGLKDLSEGKFAWKGSISKNVQAKGSVQGKGENLEVLFKDILCGVTKSRQKTRSDLYEEHLAYQGGDRNPPDAILRGGEEGDAFEIKKATSTQELQLNSSYPHSRIERGKSRMTKMASEIEPDSNWKYRDLFYVVGDVRSGAVTGNWLWIVEGQVLAQETSHYERLEEEIREPISEALTASKLNFSITNELGKVINVDHLGRTNLRIRGMWLMLNPRAIFEEKLDVAIDTSAHCTVIVLLTMTKWDRLLALSNPKMKKFWKSPPASVTIKDCKVDEPDGGDQQLECKLLVISIPA